MTKLARFVNAILIASILSACGGGGGGDPAPSAPPAVNDTAGGNTIASAAPNVASIAIGPITQNFKNVNILWTTVTLCVPGGACQPPIPNVLVDTGSYGLRILASQLSITLPQEAGSTNPIWECQPFVSGGYTWGKVAAANITISGESASNIPVQVIDDQSIPANGTNPSTAPTACTGTHANIGTSTALTANGILGIGNFTHDCGSGCAPPNSTNNIYFECPASGCASGATSSAESLALQVQNPVPSFPIDNNGVIVELPLVSSAASISGSLVFGIGTQSNNALGSAKVVPLDAYGNFITTYKGQSLTNSFFDTGSNALYFPDSIPLCAGTLNQFYCPATPQNPSAVMQGQASITVPFFVADPATAAGAVFRGLAGPMGGSSAFDWGIPFFLGRNVYFAISGAAVAGNAGPFVAF